MTRTYPALLLALALPAQALTFQTRMEDVQWQVTGDQFACRLSQSVAGYGEATFVRLAGEQPAFELKAWDNPMTPGAAQLYNEAPPWRPGSNAVPVGQMTVHQGAGVMQVPYQQAGRMLAGLASGLQPTIMRTGYAGGDPVRVVVSSVGYQQAWLDFQKCVSGLLPVSYAQISESLISFASGGDKLSAQAKAMLDAAVIYIKADADIQEILLDGHSDNQGNRLDNRELSRQRVLAVKDYLVEQGVNEELFALRFHGDRYPLASNRTEQGRAANRRVMLRLEKE
ncbi:MAG: OmpA family protein [Halopseudomonas sp.]|uniref:flagellar protein MotY n=1 Tax=Halopseudomonas sp. TaxID=2901191 RepID=UPI0030029134